MYITYIFLKIVSTVSVLCRLLYELPIKENNFNLFRFENIIYCNHWTCSCIRDVTKWMSNIIYILLLQREACIELSLTSYVLKEFLQIVFINCISGAKSFSILIFFCFRQLKFTESVNLLNGINNVIRPDLNINEI